MIRPTIKTKTTIKKYTKMQSATNLFRERFILANKFLPENIVGHYVQI